MSDCYCETIGKEIQELINEKGEEFVLKKLLQEVEKAEYSLLRIKHTANVLLEKNSSLAGPVMTADETKAYLDNLRSKA